MKEEEKAMDIICKNSLEDTSKIRVENFEQLQHDIARAIKDASSKDTERMDWIENTKNYFVLNIANGDLKFSVNSGRTWYDTLRQAIDAEMEPDKCKNRSST